MDVKGREFLGWMLGLLVCKLAEREREAYALAAMIAEADGWMLSPRWSWNMAGCSHQRRKF